MKSRNIQLSSIICLALSFPGCSGSPSSPSGDSGGASGNGGSAGATGGTSNPGGVGGSNAVGGSTTTGGSKSNSATGGAANTGGSKAAGGSSATGGAVTTGGSKPTGGNGTTGGVPNTGGSKAAGGTNATGGSKSTGGNSAAGGSSASCPSSSNNYDQTVLCDRPVAYLAMNKASGSEPDLTNNGHTGTHQGGTVPLVALPNADQASDFNGSSQYVTIPSSAVFSIPTAHNLTWEAWIRPDVLQFPNDSGGYIDWMGKCQDYSPTCEWEARMYDLTNGESRPSRISAYVFNPSAGLGSAADWQPVAGLIQAGQWYHVVGEYTTLSQPSDCSNAATYPGSINIWVNGVEWNHSSHGQTGCMSQYNVIPVANGSAVNIGTMAQDAWFQGAIGKVAFYNVLLSQTQIANHYQVMTGKVPTGSCAATCNF